MSHSLLKEIRRLCRRALEKASARYHFRAQKSLPKPFRTGIAIFLQAPLTPAKASLESFLQANDQDLPVTFFVFAPAALLPELQKSIAHLARSLSKSCRLFFLPESQYPNLGARINGAMRMMLMAGAGDRNSISNTTQDGAFDVLGFCTGNLLFHPSWLTQTFATALWAKAAHKLHILGPFSAFHSDRIAAEVPMGNYDSPNGAFIVKQFINPTCLFFYRQDWLQLGPFDESEDFLSHFNQKLYKLEVRASCTNLSYVEPLDRQTITPEKKSGIIYPRPLSSFNLAPVAWPKSFSNANISTLAYFRDIGPCATLDPLAQSQLPLDVVIVATQKDEATLPLVLQSIKRHLRHPIANLFLVIPKAFKPGESIIKEGVILINEEYLLPITKDQITYQIVGQPNRAGWLYQQLLKLGANTLGVASHFYVIDADTVLTRSQKFEHEGKDLLLHSDQFHLPYLQVCQQLLDPELTQNPFCQISFVAHQTLFNKHYLSELKADLERRFQTPWYEAILKKVDYSDQSGFAEHELYGNWVLEHHPHQIVREYWHNLESPRTGNMSLESIERLAQAYQSTSQKVARSVSLHSYLPASIS